MKEYIVGIDFGHGETSAWIAPTAPNASNYYEGESLKLMLANTIAERSCYSVIYKDANGNFSIDNLTGNPIGGFKLRISLFRDPINSERKEAFRAYIKEIFKKLLNNNSMLRYQNGNYNFDLCIACPTRWSLDDKVAYLNFFNEALSEFNIEVLWVVNESDAAFFTHGNIERYRNKCVLIIDYGSSTIDYTVINNGKKISNDNWSNQLGASNIEKCILESIRNKNDFQNRYNRIMNALSSEGMSHIDICSCLNLELRKEKERSVISNSYPNIHASYNMIAKYTTHFKQSMEYKNDIPNYRFDIDADMFEDIQEYQNCVEADFIQLKHRIDLITNGKKISYVILSGGACLMPWVKPLVENIFEPTLGVDVDNAASFVVAKGIALYARAQMYAHNDYIAKINQTNFKDLYAKADSLAITSSIKQLMPTMINELKSGKDVTGNVIRECFCNFLEGLNSKNENYCHLVQEHLNTLVSKSVADIIKDVIRQVFHIDIDTSDIKLHLNAKIIDWNPSLFTPNGTFYQHFTEWIKKNSNALFIFEWGKVRNNSELNNIIDNTKVALEKIIIDELVVYPENILVQYAEEIKEMTIEQSKQFFFRKQLFETTFKNN